MNPFPSISQAYAYVKQDERAKQGYHSSPKLSPLANSVEIDAKNSKKSSVGKFQSAGENVT